MHWTGWIALTLLLTVPACSRRKASTSQDFPAPHQPSASTAPSSSGAGPAIVTPAAPKVGRVSLVNPSARYVIVTYAAGQLPARENRLYVYRDGLKVAELKVTDFTRDINAAADITAGECQVGDEVRDH